MLVLSRKHNETLHIGNDIVITIVRVRGDSVRIGIQAPKEIHVMRSELLGTPSQHAAAPELNDAKSASTSQLDAAQQPSPRRSSSRQSALKQARSKQPAGTADAAAQSAGKAAVNEGEGDAASHGPLAKFLKVFPKVELATAS